MELFLALILATGIFPSWTALSESVAKTAPSVYRYTGPLNPLKLAIPVLLYYLWKRRGAFSPTFLKVLGLAWIIGSLSTLVAAIPCHFPPGILREWSVITLGLGYALAFHALPAKYSRAILSFWAAAVIVSIFLEMVFPQSTQWLYQNVFDPETRRWDRLEISSEVMTGIFGRQSLAKLLLWVPWLLLWKTPPGRGFVLTAVFCIVSNGLILGTSQRGPFLAGVLASLFFLWKAWQLSRDPRVLKIGLTALVGSGLIMAIFTPSSIWKPRLQSLLHFQSASQEEGFQTAWHNSIFRMTITQLSLQSIAKSPFGNACIPTQDFNAKGISPSHSHSLFLEQFRARGWIWGTIHLALWGIALLAALKTANLAGAALSSAILGILVSGLFDHPWWVLNHALVLAVALVGGLLLRFEVNRPLR